MKNEHTGICFLKYLKIGKNCRKAEKVKNLTGSLPEGENTKIRIFVFLYFLRSLEPESAKKTF